MAGPSAAHEWLGSRHDPRDLGVPDRTSAPSAERRAVERCPKAPTRVDPDRPSKRLDVAGSRGARTAKRGVRLEFGVRSLRAMESWYRVWK